MVPSDLLAERPPRVNILGVGVHALTMKNAMDLITQAITAGHQGYVCHNDVNCVMEGYRDPELKRIYHRSFLSTPDGMPTVWIGKLQGYHEMERVYGPELMLEIMKKSPAQGWSHFFYGGNPGIAQELAEKLTARFPGLKVAGTYTPPFRPLTPAEEGDLIEQVRTSKPDFFWVGLSSPKQDRFMAAMQGKLDTKLMMGVGAAFDFHTGRVKEAPRWIQRAGLQWLHRLIQEPRRLAKRYFKNNPLFIFLSLLQLTGLRRFEEPRE